MINGDVNDQFSQYSGDQKETLGKNHAALIVLSIWLVFCAIWVILYIPKIETAVSETNFIEVITNLNEYAEISDSTTADLFYVDINGNTVKVLSRVTVTGASKYHDAIEGLLKGPNNYALSLGAVSCIPSGTILNGLTVNGKWAFVDLSAEFMNSFDMWAVDYQILSCKQILLTLNAINSRITDLVLLIDGEEYTQYEI